MDFILDFFANNFYNCVWLAVILVAFCPTLESKIAIPLAMNTAIWGTHALSPFTAFILSFLGSLLPCYAIMLIIRKIKSKTSGFIIDKILKKYISKSQNLENHKSDFSKYFTLAAFVSVPLPLTGVWSGSLIAGLANLNINYCFIAITIGSLISAAAITLLCTIFENSIAYIFMISLVIIITFMFVDLFISLIKSKAKKKKNS